MIDVVAQDDAITGLVLATTSGFTRVSASRVIDASGDAAAVFKMGLPTTKGHDGAIQNPTMMFKIGNVDLPRFLDYWGEDTISPPKVVAMLETRSGAGAQEGLAVPDRQSWRGVGEPPRSPASTAERLM